MYDEEVADDICDRMATGRSLVKVCEELRIGYRTVMTWLNEHDDFRQNYARARDDQADYHADEIIDIADDGKLTPDDRRVRIDARKWHAGKMKPKKYGEKTTTEISGPDGKPIEYKNQSDDELNRRIAELAAKARP